MDVSLPPELESYIVQEAASGKYSSASEVVREALLLLQGREHLQALRSQLDKWIAEADCGEPLDGEEVFAALRSKSHSRKPA